MRASDIAPGVVETRTIDRGHDRVWLEVEQPVADLDGERRILDRHAIPAKRDGAGRETVLKVEDVARRAHARSAMRLRILVLGVVKLTVVCDQPRQLTGSVRARQEGGATCGLARHLKRSEGRAGVGHPASDPLDAFLTRQDPDRIPVVARDQG